VPKDTVEFLCLTDWHKNQKSTTPVTEDYPSTGRSGCPGEVGLWHNEILNVGAQGWRLATGETSRCSMNKLGSLRLVLWHLRLRYSLGDCLSTAKRNY